MCVCVCVCVGGIVGQNIAKTCDSAAFAVNCDNKIRIHFANVT